jgi:hypothetical protein
MSVTVIPGLGLPQPIASPPSGQPPYLSKASYSGRVYGPIVAAPVAATTWQLSAILSPATVTSPGETITFTVQRSVDYGLNFKALARQRWQSGPGQIVPAFAFMVLDRPNVVYQAFVDVQGSAVFGVNFFFTVATGKPQNGVLC